MKRTGLFYSFNTRKTSLAAEKIKLAFEPLKIETVNVENLDEQTFLSFDNLVLGVPTWFDGELPNYWDEFVPAIEDMDLKGKTIALFGLGDQVNYPENFGDAVGILGELLEHQGATLVGETLAEGYTFEHSKALRGDKFMGLLLDFDNQKSQSEKKITEWVEKLKEILP